MKNRVDKNKKVSGQKGCFYECLSVVGTRGISETPSQIQTNANKLVIFLIVQ